MFPCAGDDAEDREAVYLGNQYIKFLSIFIMVVKEGHQNSRLLAPACEVWEWRSNFWAINIRRRRFSHSCDTHRYVNKQGTDTKDLVLDAQNRANEQQSARNCCSKTSPVVFFLPQAKPKMQ